MVDFLANLKSRMPAIHYDIFMDSQSSARSSLSDKLSNGSVVPPSVNVPIVISRHPIAQKYVGRAYLPVIVGQYQSEDKLWCNLKVLYLDVTSATTLMDLPSSPGYFGCLLADRAARLKYPISVFLSYNHLDAAKVECIREHLVHLGPSVFPWLDRDKIQGSDRFDRNIAQGIRCTTWRSSLSGRTASGPTRAMRSE